MLQPQNFDINVTDKDQPCAAKILWTADLSKRKKISGFKLTKFCK